LPPKHSYAREVRIVPKTSRYIVEVVYEKPVTVADFNPKFIAGIDLGIDNLVAMTAHKPTFRPAIYDGNHLKSILVSTSAPAWLQSQLETGKYTARQIQQITLKRNKRVENYFHQTSSLIVKRLVSNLPSPTTIIGC